MQMLVRKKCRQIQEEANQARDKCESGKGFPDQSGEGHLYIVARLVWREVFSIRCQTGLARGIFITSPDQMEYNSKIFHLVWHDCFLLTSQTSLGRSFFTSEPDQMEWIRKSFHLVCVRIFHTHARLVWEGVLFITSQTSLAKDIYTNATDQITILSQIRSCLA